MGDAPLCGFVCKTDKFSLRDTALEFVKTTGIYCDTSDEELAGDSDCCSESEVNLVQILDGHIVEAVCEEISGASVHPKSHNRYVLLYLRNLFDNSEGKKASLRGST